MIAWDEEHGGSLSSQHCIHCISELFLFRFKILQHPFLTLIQGHLTKCDHCECSNSD